MSHPTARRRTLLALVGLGTLAATAVFAQPAPGTLPPPGGPQNGPDHGAEMFLKADLNRDGYLTRDEMMQAQSARVDRMFRDWDTNNDGKLSKEELEAGRAQMKQKFMQRRQSAPAQPPR